MKKLSIYWLLVVIFVDEGDFGCHGQQKEESFALGGYLPDYRVGNFDANASAPFLTDLMLFSIQPHSRGMVGGCCLDSSHFEKAREAKALNNDMRLWVTVGGGGRSDAFPEIAANEIKTKRLVDSMIRLWYVFVPIRKTEAVFSR